MKLRFRPLSIDADSSGSQSSPGRSASIATLSLPLQAGEIREAEGLEFTLPTRSLENYKYTDFSRLLPSIEFECSPSKNLVLMGVSDAFSKILEAIDTRTYPLAGLALAYPSSDKSQDSSQYHWQNKVVFIQVKAGEHSVLKLELTEPKIFSNALYVILLEKNSHLKVEVLTKPGETRDIFTAQHFEVWQEADSVFEIFYENQGQKFGRYDLHAKLIGERAICRAFGTYQCQGEDHIDHHLLMEHLADHTRSEQFFKGTADHKSHAVFNGKAIVHSKIKHADAKQHNFNLLLSPLAEVDTKPELEVFTDIVTAAHGATVGQLDEDALFYLESRGISASMAKEILIEGFLGDVRGKFEKS
jgi:hypothetical protein